MSLEGPLAKVSNREGRAPWCAPTRKDPDRRDCCVRIDGPPPDRPDLAIYSQDEQFGLGVAPTWDNPDILTNLWSPFKLLPETNVTVRNLSATASALNVMVSLFTSPFGLGMPRTLLAVQYVGVPPGQQVVLLYALTQALLNGADPRIGVYVRIDHPHDSRLINNAGSQLIADAYTNAVGRSFTVDFPVRNPAAAAQQITLSALPNQLNAIVSPAVRNFAPLEQVTATLKLQVPAGTHGAPGAEVRSDATVVARAADGSVIGGLTYVIWINN